MEGFFSCIKLPFYPSFLLYYHGKGTFMIEINEILKLANEIGEEAVALREQLQISMREERLLTAEKLTEDPNIWDDPENAQTVMQDAARRRNELLPWRRLKSLTDDNMVLVEILGMDIDEDSVNELQKNTSEIRALLDKLRTEALFAEEYDDADAIIEVNAGAGGTEACDWAEMLGRMYLRWAERSGFDVEVMDSLAGDQAGVKSMTIEIHGQNAYGLMKSERGTHRLIRFSPFNAKGSRETSFASVSVIPDVTEDVNIDIREEDLRIDTYRASSAGGQHVNKTESAIRITHIPSGLVVTCQNERSQLKNRASAMRVLKSRLAAQQRQEQEEALAKLQGKKLDIAFGSQIRTYFLQPYTLVKDHRTEHETPNAFQVLDGEIDGFLVAYLQYLAQQRISEE
jgi:peptide chain release factor 2